MKQVQATLLSKKIVAPDVVHLYFYVGGDGLFFEPGQYAIVTIPSSPAPLKRLYSFAGSNKDKSVFELLVKIIPGGISSTFLASLSVGSSITVTGPAGLFTQKKTEKRKVYMVTGTGFAPLRSFLQSTQVSALNSVLYWGVKDLSETYLFDELLALKKASPGFSFYYCLSRQPSLDTIPADLLHYFRSGHIDAVWATLEPLIGSSGEYYLCGSRTVVESLRTTLLARGVAKENLLFEKY